ncbi:hypothetical protein [Methylobacterium nonmethylotrophicum]|uniref:Uncharacterized protein n=1 Tax=Methylobacterium nonmethylotrophicum TaxID=1141884 RepID=A0A4Z0NWX6_9HYPH|nr:hypothetical protein [Methylobacterium nonmethylotrophicum]TGE01069.1 hypothetical protein EU555_05535 [Methylobacterium nonmethylotrophicum]
MSQTPVQPSTIRELDDDTLDMIVGGVTAAATDPKKRAQDLIHEDLIAHDAGGNRTDEIAALVITRQVQASDVIAYVEANAAADRHHSADQQLVQIRTSLQQHNASASLVSAFTTEESARIATGQAAKDLGRLVQAGDMTGQAAAATIEAEASRAGRTQQITSLSDLDRQVRGGNEAVEVEIARLKLAGGSLTAAITGLESAAQSGHRSADAALLALEQATGGFRAVEAEMAARLSSGAAATDLAALVKDGTLTGQAAIQTIEAEATIAGASRIGAVTGLSGKLGSDAAVEAEIARLLPAASAAEAKGAIQALEAGWTSARKSIDAGLVALEQTTGGSKAVEAEIAARLASGDAASDLAALVKGGSLTAQAAVQAAAAKAAATAGSRIGAVAQLDVRLGGNAAVEAEIGRLLAGASAAEAKSAIQALEAGWAAQKTSVDAGLAALEQASGGSKAVEAEMAARLASGAAASDLAALVKGGSLTEQAAVRTIEAEAAAAGTGQIAAATQLAVRLGGSATVEAEIGRLLPAASAADAKSAIQALEAGWAAQKRSVDAGLVALEQASGGSKAVEAEIAARLSSGAAATDLAALVRGGSLTAQAAIQASTAEAAAAAGGRIGALAQLDGKLGGSAAVEAEIGRLLPAASAAEAKGAIQALEAVWTAQKTSIEAGLLALEQASGGSKAVEAEIAARLGNGSAASDLWARVQSRALTDAAAARTIEAAAAAAGADPIEALARLDGAMRGDAAVRSEIVRLMSQPGADAAKAVQDVERWTKASGQSVDAALAALDGIAGGHAAIRSELAARLASGAATSDLAGLVQRGAMTESGAITAIEAAASRAGVDPAGALTGLDGKLGGSTAVEVEVARLALAAGADPATAITSLEAAVAAHRGSVDAALVSLDGGSKSRTLTGDNASIVLTGARSGNPAVEAEIAARLASGAAASDLAALVRAGAITEKTAIGTIEAEVGLLGGSLVQPLARLDGALGGNAAVEAEIARLMPLWGPGIATVIRDFEAGVAASGRSVDAALLVLDKATGGKPEIAAEINARLANGTTAADLAALVKAGSLTDAAAVQTLEAVATRAGANPLTALTKLVGTMGAGAAIEGEIGRLLPTGTIQEQFDALRALERAWAAQRKPVDAALLVLDLALGGRNEVVASEIGRRAYDGSAARDLGALVQSGATTGQAAVQTIEAAVARGGGRALDALAALEAASAGDAAVEGELVRLLRAGTVDDARVAIPVLESTWKAQGKSVDAGLLALDQALGGRTAVRVEIGQRLFTGATADDLGAAVRSGAMTDQAAAQTIVAAAARLGESPVAALARLDGTLGSNKALEAEIARAALAGGADAATALQTLKAAFAAQNRPVDGALLALDQAMGGNKALEAEMAARLASGATMRDLAAQVAGGTLTGLGAAQLVAAEAAAAGMSPAAALARLDGTLGGNAVAGEIGRLLDRPGTDAAAAIRDIEAGAAAAGRSVDATLVALDAALGGRPALAAEMAARLANGATSRDLHQALTAGTLAGDAVVTVIEAEATRAGVGQVAALTAFARSGGGRPEILAEIARQVGGGAAEAELARMVASGALNAEAAASILSEAVFRVAAGSADHATALGMNLEAAQAVAAAKLDAAARDQVAALPADPGQAGATQAARANLGALAALLEGGQYAVGLARARRVAAAAGGADALQAGIDAALAQPDRSAATTVLGVEAAAAVTDTSVDAALLAADRAAGDAGPFAAELARRFASGAAEFDLAQKVGAGTMSASASLALAQDALATLAGRSADHATVLGMSLAAATDIAAARLDAAAAALAKDSAWQAAQAVGASNAQRNLGTVAGFLEGAHAADLAGAGRIVSTLGGAAALQAGMDAALAQPSPSAPPTLFSVEAGAAAANASVDAALLAADRAAGGSGPFAAELARRLASGAAEADLVRLVGDGALGAADALKVAQDALGTLAARSADRASALGMSLGAATDIVEATLDAAAAALRADFAGQPAQTASTKAAQANLGTLTSLLEGAHGAELARAARIIAAVGGADALAKGLADGAAHPGRAAEATAFGSIASGVDDAGRITGSLTVSQVAAQIETAASAAAVSGIGRLEALDLALGGSKVVQDRIAALGKAGQDATAAIGVVETMAPGLHADPVAALSALDKLLGGNAAVADEVAARKAMQTTFDMGIGGGTKALMDLANKGNAAATRALADALLDGRAEADLAREIAAGHLSGAEALDRADEAVALVQKAGPGAGATVLPGLFEGGVVVSRLYAEAAALAHTLSQAKQGGSTADKAPVSPAATYTSLAVAGPGTAPTPIQTPPASGRATPSEEFGFLRSSIETQYGVAMATGGRIVPVVEALGGEVASLALATGARLATGDAATSAARQGDLIAALEGAAASAHVSTDAALALASFAAAGLSEGLKIEMTGRLLSGKAEVDIATLVAHGQMRGDVGLSVLLNAVNALASANAGQSALGYDETTAGQLVAAKLDLAAVAVGQAEAAAAKAGGFGAADHLAAANAAAGLRDRLEATNGVGIVAGLGAELGLIAGTAADAGTRAEAQTISEVMQALMPKVIAAEIRANPGSGTSAAALLPGQSVPEPTPEQVAQQAFQISNDLLTDFHDKYAQSRQIDYFRKNAAEADSKGTNDPKKEGLEKSIDVTLKTHTFLSESAAAGVAAQATADLGSGIIGTVLAQAGASAAAAVTATGVSVHATAIAGTSATLDLGGHASVKAFAQALADGDVTAGITGIKLKGYVGVQSGVTATQSEQGTLAGGLDGVQTTTLMAIVRADASAAASLGLTGAEVKYGARAGAYVSAGEEGTLLYKGYEASGGAAIASPGATGLDANIKVGVDGGNIAFGIDAFIGLALFGAELKFDLKLPTADVVAAFKKAGSAFEEAGGKIEHGFDDAWKVLKSPF